MISIYKNPLYLRNIDAREKLLLKDIQNQESL